ncbi:MAG: aldehyde dehydrogenase [Saprospiraceae bacterium]|nr:aldehyde dehydrogenase [Saprospiraceae bacterium]
MNDLKISNAAEAFLNNIQHHIFVNNKWVEARNDRTIKVVNPADYSSLGEVSVASKDDVQNAIDCAKSAFQKGAWHTMSPVQREGLLLNVANVFEDHLNPMAEILTLENGKLLSHAKSEIKGAINTLRYYAGWVTKIEGHTIDISLRQKPGFKNFAFIKKEPVGVVAAIVPWNFPISIAIWKLAPLLAAGCTVVLKPSEVTPLSTLYMAQLFEIAGFPPGVVNVVTGDAETGSALTSNPSIDKITFTGSTKIGKIIGQSAINNLTPISLELGGKSPAVIFDDADLTAAAKGTALGIFRNGGQVCVAGSRVYIHKKVYDNVLADIKLEGEKLKISDGFDPDADLGPLVSSTHLDHVKKYIEKGLENGATLVTGGNSPEIQGAYLKPTIFSITDNKATIVQEEIFGPVLAAIPFDDMDEAMRLANETQYGLSSTVWTKDISKALKCVDAIDAGWVFVNGPARSDANLPIGGNKNSGIGRELGKEGLYAYMKSKSVNIIY